MKVFVWADVGQCSDSYHSGGGVVVFAETEQRAREIANATPFLSCLCGSEHFCASEAAAALFLSCLCGSER